MHPWNGAPRSFGHALDAARERYATHGPLLAQAIRLREAASALRQRAYQLEWEAFELEAVAAEVARCFGHDWWDGPSERRRDEDGN